MCKTAHSSAEDSPYQHGVNGLALHVVHSHAIISSNVLVAKKTWQSMPTLTYTNYPVTWKILRALELPN